MHVTVWQHEMSYPLSGGNRQMAGLSLIEMLIAVLIIAVGLLGLAGLQSFSLKNNTSAYHRSQANTLAYDILDCMRSNRPAALAGSYVVTLDSNLSSVASRAESDVSYWLDNLAHYLPSGDGSIACNNAICTVTVIWDDSRVLTGGQTCRSNPAACQQISVSSRL